MSNLIGKVLDRLVDLMTMAHGQDSNFADREWLVNYLKIVNDDLESEIEGLDLNFDTQVVVLPNVPANTLDLSAYQADGQPLENLVTPISGDGDSALEWRLAGQSDLNWAPVLKVGKLIDTNTATGNTGDVVSNSAAVASYEWRGGIIVLSPASVAVDLRIRGEFLPTLADNDAATFIKGLANVLAYATGEMVSTLAAGEEAKEAAWFRAMAAKAKDDFVCRLTKSKHGQVIRFGGRRTLYPGISGALTPPIVS